MNKARKLSILYLPFVSLCLVLLAYALRTFDVIGFRGQFLFYQFTDMGLLWGAYILIKNKGKLCNATKIVIISYMLICALNEYFFIFLYDPAFSSGLSPVYSRMYDIIFFIALPIQILSAGFAIIYNRNDACE